jgi:hypothetical protein
MPTMWGSYKDRLAAEREAQKSMARGRAAYGTLRHPRGGGGGGGGSGCVVTVMLIGLALIASVLGLRALLLRAGSAGS